MNPRELGPYLLLRKLSQSALVETYRAGERDGQDVQRVVLLCFFNADPEDATWLAETAQAGRRALRGLAAPSLGSAVDSGEIEGTAYLAYDYISGGDLRTLMDRSRTQGAPVSLGHALMITDRIAQALLAAWQHESRALHGFVVPQLVMLSTEGDVQLLGLEVASRLRRLLTNETIKQEVGSYLAPEVVPEGQPSTIDDVFSLGALLYELTTGRTLPKAPPGGYEAIIEDARLTDGGPLPEAVSDLLDSSLAPGPKRDNLKNWQSNLDREVVSGNYEASAFDLALYLHAIFADELQAVDPLPRPADAVDLTPPVPEEPEAEAPPTPEARVEEAGNEVAPFALPVETEPDVEPAEALPENMEDKPARSSSKRRMAVAAAIAALALVSFLAYKFFPSSPETTTALAEASLAPAQQPSTGSEPVLELQPADKTPEVGKVEPGESVTQPTPARDRPVERTETPPVTKPATVASPTAKLVEPRPQPPTLDSRVDQPNQDPVAKQQEDAPESPPLELAAPIELDPSSETLSSPEPATPGTAGSGIIEDITEPEVGSGETESSNSGPDPKTPLESSPENSSLEIEDVTPPAPLKPEAEAGGSRVETRAATTRERQDFPPTNSRPADPPPSPPASSTSTQVDRSSAPAEAQPELQLGDLVEFGPDVIAPRMTNTVEPVYPMVARRLKKRASVSVRALIDETGKVLKVERLGGEAGYGFDVAALNAARKITWEPATKNGIAVKVWWTVRIEFQL